MGCILDTAYEEIEKYKYLYDGISDEALKRRTKISLEFYIKKAHMYKFWWSVFTIGGVIFPTVATLLSVMANSGDVKGCEIAFFTSLTTIITGLSSGFKIADKKSTYRDSAERMKRVLSKYQTKISGVEKGKKLDKLTKQLSDDVEDIIAEEKIKISQIENNEKV